MQWSNHMIRAGLLVSVCALAGCSDLPITDHCDQGACGGDGTLRPTVVGLFPSGQHTDGFDTVPAGWQVGTLAAGGRTRARVEDVTYLEVKDGPFRVEGADRLDGSVATIEVIADAAGDGALAFNGYPGTAPAHARLVQKVALVPPRLHRRAASAALVWHVSEPAVVIAIESGERYPYDGQLVDGSLAVTEPGAGVTMPAWDTVRLDAPAPGPVELAATADSFGSFRATVRFVDRIERLESTIEPFATVADGEVPVGAGAMICFHGFTGADEVFADVQFEAGPDVRMIAHEDNCREVVPDVAGPITVRATMAGTTRELALTAVEVR